MNTPGVSYKGMMFSNVPNFAFSLGYGNASWTLSAIWWTICLPRAESHDRHGYDLRHARLDVSQPSWISRRST